MYPRLAYSVSNSDENVSKSFHVFPVGTFIIIMHHT